MQASSEQLNVDDELLCVPRYDDIDTPYFRGGNGKLKMIARLRDNQSCQPNALVRKSSWPELVGEQGEVAVETIERENPTVTAVIVPEGSFVTTDYVCTRVRVWVDENGTVTRKPTIG
ncbi:glu S.griseus protease inhibitor-like [Telopea speciosissima]|uniref:glu S.griseus protease inhibitor-like n=1 Tax=Telopea speciosissima TaxID=54955 RepID=UPI001CC4A98E|nr:glu S.griseus protease inhibitor-like [Telopea speciosissima]